MTRTHGWVVGAALAALASSAFADAARDAKEAAAVTPLVLQFCAKYKASYSTDLAYSKQKDQAAVPLPPEINPPCQACGSTAPPSTADADAQKFVADSLEPENHMITELLDISKQLQLLTPLTNDIQGKAKKCFKVFDEDAVNNAAVKLASRVFYQKAQKMVQMFKKQSKRLYAGELFALAALNNYQRVFGMVKTQEPAPDISQITPDLVFWTRQAINDGETQILTGKKYNLCPSYITLYRQIQTLAGKEAPGDMQALTDITLKIDKLLRFKVEMDLHAAGTSDDGSQFDLAWHGETTLHIKLPGGGCYTPELLPDASVAITIKNFKLVDKNGNHAEYISPKQFKLPVKAVHLSLCDASPALTLTFPDDGPDELLRMYVKGHTQDTQSKIAIAMLDVVARKAASDAAKSSAQTMKEEIDKLKSQIMAHQSDPMWITSPEGQAVLAKLQALATGAVGDATSFDLSMRWTNGTGEVVSETQTYDGKGKFADLVKLHVQQLP